MSRRVLPLVLALGLCGVAPVHAGQGFALTRIGGFDSGLGEGASEIVAYDAASQRAFVVNAVAANVDIVDLSNPAAPTLAGNIDVAAFGAAANSVAVSNGLVAVAVEAATATDPGRVAFFDTAGNALGSVQVGVLPDMVTFTPDGRMALVANEGEPNDDYDVDPEGSVSIVDLSAGVAAASVRTVGFADFNVGGPRAGELPAGVRIYGPGASVAQDLEPEYIAASNDTAFVALQENNAIARIDLVAGRVEQIIALPLKDHSLPGQGLDPSDRDAGIAIGNWPLFGLRQPDSIALTVRGGVPYVLTANEGDTRDYDGYSEEERVKDLTLDGSAFPNAADLQQDEQIGRLIVTTAQGDLDNDGDFDRLFVPGARSFSIIDGNSGALSFDSGDDFEQITAMLVPALFNSQGDPGSFDGRSDNKGPEPEALTTGRIGGREFAFIGMERIGGVFIYDIEDVAAPQYQSYTPAQGGDLSPEGISFVAAEQSPNGRPLLLIAHEVSGTLGVYQIDACVISAIDATVSEVSVFGYCPDGFDLYQNGQLVQAGIALNGFQVIDRSSRVGDRYFAALPGNDQPINGIVGVVTAIAVPLGAGALLLLGLLLAGVGALQLRRG